MKELTEEHFNRKMEELNSKADKILEILKVTGTMTKEVYLKTQSIPNQPIVSKPQSIPTGDKIPKNTINWDAFKTISDTKTLEIVTGMYNTNYPTVTSGQFKLLRDIGLKHKIDISI